MSVQTKAYFEGLFVTGYTPTETDYKDLWDSILWWLTSINSLLKRVIWEVDFSIDPLTTTLTGGLPLIPISSSIVKVYYRFTNLTYSNGNGTIDIKTSLDGDSLLHTPIEVSDINNTTDYADGIIVEETLSVDNEIMLEASGTDITAGTFKIIVEYLNFD